MSRMVLSAGVVPPIDWGAMFFQSWHAVARTLVVGVLAYGGLVAILLASGKRTLSKFNAFDFVVTVAFGSTLATILLSRDVALAEGLVALGLLVGLQALVTWTSVRYPRFQSLVKAKPALLYYQGRWLEDALRANRVTREEVFAAVRSEGLGSLEDVSAVILETQGEVSVVRQGVHEESDVLEPTKGWPEEKGAP